DSKLSFGTACHLPGSVVHVGDQMDQADPVGVLQVEQRVEIPVQVVGEVRDLVPQRLLRVELHGAAGRDTSSMRARLRIEVGGSSGSTSSASAAASVGWVPSSSAGAGDRSATVACSVATSSGSPKLMIP